MASVKTRNEVSVEQKNEILNSHTVVCPNNRPKSEDGTYISFGSIIRNIHRLYKTFSKVLSLYTICQGQRNNIRSKNECLHEHMKIYTAVD
jgi:hypothetical protein